MRLTITSKRFRNILLLISFFSWQISCINQDELISNNKAPVISSIIPDAGEPGDTITLTGTNFQDITTDSVYINGEVSQLISLFPEEIEFIVPDSSTTGPVAVKNQFGFTIGPEFTVLIKKVISITSVSPNQGLVGTTVKIIGENFNDLSPTFKLLFNGTKATTNVISSQELTSTVPQSATTGLISIVDNNKIIQGPLFTVFENNPVITNISPLAGPVGTLVTITGKNFGSSIADVAVKLNGVLVTINSISETEIQFNVPANASSGNISVTVLSINKTAIGPIFTVQVPLVNVVTVATPKDGINSPGRIISDGNGNFLFTDTQNHQIKRITPAGVITLFAGTGQAGFLDGKSGNAQFNTPIGLARDPKGNIYVADAANNVIRMINTSAVVTTIAGNIQAGLADGLALLQAQFNQPIGLAFNNNVLYIADNSNHAIRQLDLQSGMVTTIAGNGTPGFLDGKGTSSRLNRPLGITVDLDGNILIADAFNHSIRFLDLSSGILSTITGFLGSGFVDGSSTKAMFSIPYDLSINSKGHIYVADANNHSIRVIVNGLTSTLAGNGTPGLQDGNAVQARFDSPAGILVNTDQELWICDFNNGAIRKIIIQ